MADSESDVIRNLNLFLDENLDNSDFSATTICQELGISRSNLYRVIKEHYNTSPSLYIRKQKLLKAKELLEISNLKVSEISYKIGIDSPQNFSKYFTQEFGINPTEHRKARLNINVELPEVEVSTQKRKFSPLKKYLRLLGTLLFIPMFGLGIYQMNSSFIDQEENQLGVEKSIAVLPFKNLGDSSMLYLSEGVMEQIHSSLASLSGLRVASTTSSNKYENAEKQTKQIGDELKVDYLLKGSVFRVDEEIRLRVELINIREDRAVWSENFEGSIKNIFDYMSSVSNEVAIKLNQKLIAKLPVKKTTQNVEAYNAYLQGQYLLQARTIEKVKASILKFEQAINLDSTFSDAIVSKALAFYIMGEDNNLSREIAFKNAETGVLKAVSIDKENGKAYAVLGNIYKAQNKWNQALTSYKTALTFNPNDAQTNYWYSLTLRSLGQMDASIKYSLKAVSLDPLAVNIYGGHIVGLAYAGRFDEAEKAIKDGELLFSNALLFHNAKGAYYVSIEDYKKALDEFEICERLDSEAKYFKVWKCYSLAKMNQQLPVESFLKSLPQKSENYKYLAIIYAGLEDKANCLRYLELAAESEDTPNYLKVSPLFRFLHKESRFIEVLQKVGL